MKKLSAGAIALAICLMPQISAENLNNRNGIRRVLLISIDGMHAVDYSNCVSGGYCPHLADLGKTGVNYTRTSTSRPSDSFPGLMALVAGGTPRLVGAFYDVAFDRVLAPPQNDTGNGVFSGACVPNTPNGTTTEYEEGVDINQTLLNGGNGKSLTDGDWTSIDSTRLPRNPYSRPHPCAPVYPWNFIRANTIYGVIHAAHGYTAWADKHAVYAAVSGPTGTAIPSNVDDYYSPDVNSNVVGLPGVTAANGRSCATPTGSGAWTDDFQDIQCYDTLKVNAVLNEIDGKTHLGNAKAPVPNIFGMNFQAVSVGQKLIEGGVAGGYMDAAGTPTPKMKDEIMFVDDSIGQIVAELKHQGLLETTLIIVTAKHGQSPIDPLRFQEKGAGISTTPADVIAGFLPPPPPGGAPENPNTPDKTVTVTRTPLKAGDKLSAIGPTQDDISLLWLAPGASVTGAVSALESSGTAGIGLGQIFYGSSLETMFNKPGLPPNGDPRTPDIIVQPNAGVVYTGSHKKHSEHGGFAQDDTNVMMLVSNPGIDAHTVTSFVETTQVAPTILQALGLDPGSLDAVRKEGTPVLPGLDFK
jgi:type I phosphodiesterase/nucleotide pyrophosphatase